MAQQTINIGTAANDGTGDAIRDSFDKVNDNFDELYNPIQTDYQTGLAVPSHNEGRIFYNENNKTLSLMNDISGSTLELGREMWERCYNDSGVLITNGSVVYISGTSGENPTIALAKADALLTSAVIGVATHDIADATEGEVCIQGKVNDINTNGWAAGTQLYLSPDTAGALTPTMPDVPNYVVPVCKVFKTGTTDGIFGIFVQNIIPPTTHGESWNYSSYLGAGSEENWIAGGIESSASFTPSGTPATFGDANEMHLAHAFIVLGAISTNMVVRVTGTRFNPSTGATTGSYTSDIDTSGGAVNDYFETPEHFIGQVSFTLLSGTAVVCNRGFCAYWDNNNTRYVLNVVEWTGFSGANDSVLLEIYVKKSDSFLYGAGGATITPILDTTTELGTNILVKDERIFKYKRTNISELVKGDIDEGLMFRVSVNLTDAVRYSTLSIQLSSQRGI